MLTIDYDNPIVHFSFVKFYTWIFMNIYLLTEKLANLGRATKT